jgi:uncharacterized protein YceH (UPF0502 family)
MTMVLNATEARVLGALMEKEATTPEYYPLSLNALVNACNQKNNREPVMELNEEQVRMALHRLDDHGLAGVARGAESRVTKYEHRVQEVFNFTRGEAAVLCVLLLRGEQTPGELRGRTERMFRFEELEDVTAVLQKLMQREPALAAALPRQPGTKEIRYAHLLSGPVGSHISEHRGDMGHPGIGHPGIGESHFSEQRGDVGHPASQGEERLQQLETDVARLREDVEQLRADLTAMKSGAAMKTEESGQD